MIILGLEFTAHTFGVGIIKIVDDSPQVICNERMCFTSSEHGIIPHELAEYFTKNAPSFIEKVLSDNKLSYDKIDLVSFSKGPGIAPVLVAGVNIVRGLEKKYDFGIIGVNHCVAHLSVSYLTNRHKEDPVFVYTSGVNTQIINKVGKEYIVVGETTDIGVGNGLDKFGRLAGLGFPAGKEIEKLASQTDEIIELPYTVKGMDMSFSGIVTKVSRLIGKHPLPVLCNSLQETCYSMLVEVAERALSYLGKREMMVTGGVAFNSRFREMLGTMCSERGAQLFEIPKEWCMDNGLMIAWQGYLDYVRDGKRETEKLDINPYWRIDE